MKKINMVLIFSLAVYLGACAPKRIQVKATPESQLFSKAESMYKQKFYEESLAAFEAYLLQFPDSPLADEALMKMRAIHTAMGNDKDAMDVLKRLVIEHPDSPFVPDAKFQILVNLYNQGEYIKVIEQASDFLEYTVSSVYTVKTYVLLGDTYMAMGLPTDAVNWYAKAFKKLKEPEKKDIIAKIKEAVNQLSSEDILFILSRIEDKLTAGYLMYQLGVNNAEEEKYGEALKVLSALVETLPDHENARQAKYLIAEIKKKSGYSRFTIGCLLPLSGPYEIYGKRALKGVELALNQYRSQNNTHPSLKVIIKDTGSDPIRAVLAVIELFDENVAAIVGPIVTAEPAAHAAQERRVPIITLTQKENIIEIGDYVFRNFFTPRMQVKSLVSYAVKELGLKRFAILYPDENYGTKFMNLFWDEVIGYGGKVVGVESYDSANTDFADQIKKLVGLYYDVPRDLRDVETDIPLDPEMPIVDFDAIFIPDAPRKAGLIIPQLAFHDVADTYLLGTNLWHSESLIEMSQRYVQGAIIPDGFFGESDSQNVLDFVTAFKNTYDQEPEFIEAVAYDTAMILFRLVSRSDVQFRSDLQKELYKLTDFQGVTALTSFDRNGDVHKKLYLLRVEGDRFVELGLH